MQSECAVLSPVAPTVPKPSSDALPKSPLKRRIQLQRPLEDSVSDSDEDRREVIRHFDEELLWKKFPIDDAHMLKEEMPTSFQTPLCQPNPRRPTSYRRAIYSDPGAGSPTGRRPTSCRRAINSDPGAGSPNGSDLSMHRPCFRRLPRVPKVPIVDDITRDTMISPRSIMLDNDGNRPDSKAGSLATNPEYKQPSAPTQWSPTAESDSSGLMFRVASTRAPSNQSMLPPLVDAVSMTSTLSTIGDEILVSDTDDDFSGF